MAEFCTLGQPARADSGSSMESLDMEVEGLNIHDYHLSGPSAQKKVSSKDDHNRSFTLNTQELRCLGDIESADSSDDESLSQECKPSKGPNGEKKRNLSYQQTRDRMKRMPLSLGSLGRVPELLSSPVSSEEDNCLSRAPRTGTLRRGNCMKLDFDKLKPCQDFLFNKDFGCTARKNANSLTSQISKFREYLFISDAKTAANKRALESKGITHVVNLAAATVPNGAPDSFIYLALTPADCPSEDIGCYFLPIMEFVDQVRSVGGKVLIHCHRGISRSCAAALAYVMLNEGISFNEALRELRSVRPVTCPNRGFTQALIKLEQSMRYGHEEEHIWRMEMHGKGACVMKRCHDCPPPKYLCEQVLVLEKPHRRGLSVFRGENVPEMWWNVIAPAIDKFAEQLIKNRTHYSDKAFTVPSAIEVEIADEHEMRRWHFDY